MNLYLVNGFLGSGKTTAIASACQQLIHQGKKVAVITNDQGDQQVDSVYIKSLSLPNSEVANGCFCCKYDEFEQNVAALKNAIQPEMMFAESVGSCTDLVATVVKPFARSAYQSKTVISVFADAYLIHSIMTGSSCFIEETVQYIYRKQLEEADIIVINKTDLLNADELLYIKQIIAADYPGKKIVFMNAYNQNDITRWMRSLNNFIVPEHRRSLEVDYEIYGAGEAKLAWLDQKISVHTTQPVALKVALVLTEMIYEEIRRSGHTIGHLKFFLHDDQWHQKISYTTNGIKQQPLNPETHHCNHLEVLINARVQTEHATLEHIVNLAIEEIMTQTGCRIVSHRLSSFQPGFPKPLYRITE